MTVTIGPRELLAALGSAAARLPLAVRAQQAGKVNRIGFWPDCRIEGSAPIGADLQRQTTSGRRSCG
jgi:hypothetical protein